MLNPRNANSTRRRFGSVMTVRKTCPRSLTSRAWQPTGSGSNRGGLCVRWGGPAPRGRPTVIPAPVLADGAGVGDVAAVEVVVAADGRAPCRRVDRQELLRRDREQGGAVSLGPLPFRGGDRVLRRAATGWRILHRQGARLKGDAG